MTSNDIEWPSFESDGLQKALEKKSKIHKK